MEEDQRKKIEEIINQFKCPRDFRCCKSHFKLLCKARDIGLETFLKCLGGKPSILPGFSSFRRWVFLRTLRLSLGGVGFVISNRR